MIRLLVLSLSLVALVGIGCDTGNRISRLEKENEDLKAEIQKNHIALDYDLQAKCSRDARAWFNENYSRDKDTLLLDFSNHYNKSSNSCMIFVEYHFRSGADGCFNDMSLWNVYENSKYGQFVESYVINNKGPSGTNVSTCEVGAQKCTNVDQFNAMMQPYMNN